MVQLGGGLAGWGRGRGGASEKQPKQACWAQAGWTSLPPTHLGGLRLPGMQGGSPTMDQDWLMRSKEDEMINSSAEFLKYGSYSRILGLPCSSGRVKNLPTMQETRPWVGKILWRREWQATPGF